MTLLHFDAKVLLHHHIKNAYVSSAILEDSINDSNSNKD